VAALEGHRLIEPRLSGGFGYAPCHPAVASSGLVPDRVCSVRGSLDLPALRRARLLIERELKAGAPPASLHAKAVLDLLQDPKAGAGKAVAWLQKVVAAAPADARAWNDLAVAYLVRGQRLDQPRDLVRALEAAERAVALDGALPEARFNLALVAESLFLPSALERWREYRDRTPERQWIEDAESRLAETAAPLPGRFGEAERTRLAAAARRGDLRTVRELVQSYPQEVREYAEEELLADWAGTASPDRGSLDIARAIGEALAGRGETLLRDSVAAIDAAVRVRDADRLPALVRGHRAFREGLKLFRLGQYGRSAVELASARRDLLSAGSPYAGRARFWEVCSVYRQGRAGEAAAAFATLADELAGRSWGALRGHVFWMQGVIRVEASDPAGGLHHYEAALASFLPLGEQGNVNRVRGLLAAAFHQIGQHRDGWEQAWQALRGAGSLHDPFLRSRAYSTAADLALAEGYLHAALVFQEEAVREAGLAERDEALVDALFWRGLMRSRSGDRAGALADIRRARRELARLSDASALGRMSADVGMAEGELLLAGHPDQAVGLLSGALTVYEKAGNNLLAVWVRRLRAQAFRRLGRLDLAEADLRAALAAYETLGAEKSVGLQLAFFARTEEAFDEMIAFQAFDRGRPEEAFLFADLAHTRVLPSAAVRTRAGGLDPAGRQRLLTSESRPLGLSGIRDRLPAGTSLVQYSVLPDRLLIWRVRRDGVLFVQKPVPSGELRKRIARLRSAAGSPGAWEREAGALFEMLVLPWRQGIRRGETVVIVPDKMLDALPFAALQEPETGRFLVQDFRLVFAPSATLAVDGLPAPRRPGPSGRIPALLVGNPAFDRGEWPDLADLPAAEQEAADLGRAIPGSVFLRGAGATPGAFVALAGRADLVHFAGHALADPNDPLRSLLLLAAPSQADPGALYAWQLYGLNLSGTRLVVLAACGTADPALGADEGVTSLARAFLAAGVPRVVASLWPVNDSRANRLFQAFYRHPQVAADPAGALRAAQISLLEGPEDRRLAPWEWGAFEVVATHLNP
jgi:CHAT domain-containing protein/tetratricopeptide (TPR) repeat protein